jgi:AAA domain
VDRVAEILQYREDAPAKTKSAIIVPATEVKMRSKDWLWEGYLLRGALQAFAGIPGLGKSQVHCSFVACVTNRVPWPDGTILKEPGNVLMLTAEDTLDQELVPRLLAAKADLKRVSFLKCIREDEKQRQFLLAEDLATMEAAVKHIGDVALITIDPLTAYMVERWTATKQLRCGRNWDR